MLDILSAWLREQRLARDWSVAEMGRQLQQAAKATGDHTVPRTAILASYVRRWETGKIGPTERYRLHYCTALSIPPAQFGPGLPRPQPPEPGGPSAGMASRDVVTAGLPAVPDVQLGINSLGRPGGHSGYREAGTWRVSEDAPWRQPAPAPSASAPQAGWGRSVRPARPVDHGVEWDVVINAARESSGHAAAFESASVGSQG